jgi:hypothetical protein
MRTVRYARTVHAGRSTLSKFVGRGDKRPLTYSLRAVQHFQNSQLSLLFVEGVRERPLGHDSCSGCLGVASACPFMRWLLDRRVLLAAERDRSRRLAVAASPVPHFVPIAGAAASGL